MIPPGVGNGVGAMLDQHYKRVHTVTAGAGYQHNGIDLHEFSLGPRWHCVRDDLCVCPRQPHLGGRAL